MANFRSTKRSPLRHVATALGVILILPATHSVAFAYLDPGTGSIILQALIAGVIGTAAFARMYWTRLKEIVRRTFADRENGPKN